MKRLKTWTIGVLILTIGLAACSKTSNSPNNDANQTLETLRKVDDAPLYVMEYIGDYGFEDFLRTGVQTSQQSRTPTAEDDGWACTCFSVLNAACDPLFGRNFDWYDHPSLLLFTHPPDAYASVSLVDLSCLGYSDQNPPESNPEDLLSTPYLPFDGMNEHGLAVGFMALSSAQPPVDPGKISISSTHVVRLLLDYARTVDQAIDLIRQYNISFTGGPPLHYLVADASGHSAVIEFVNGEISILWNDNPWQVSTNFTITGKTHEQALAACWRYRTAYETLEGTDGVASEAEAMNLLSDVSQSITIWSAVYNLTTKEVHVAMRRKYNAVHDFALE